MSRADERRAKAAERARVKRERRASQELARLKSVHAKRVEKTKQAKRKLDAAIKASKT